MLAFVDLLCFRRFVIASWQTRSSARLQLHELSQALPGLPTCSPHSPASELITTSSPPLPHDDLRPPLTASSLKPGDRKKNPEKTLLLFSFLHV